MAGPETKRIETLALLTGLDEKVLRHGTILEGTASQPEFGLVNKVSNLRRDVDGLKQSQDTSPSLPLTQASPQSDLESRVKELEKWKEETEPLLAELTELKTELEQVKNRVRGFVTMAAGGSGGIVALLQALLG